MAVRPIVKTFEYFLDRLLRGFRKDQGREPNNLEMILIKQEAGNKARDANKVIKVQFGRPFGEEVDELIKKGEVKIGEAPKTPPYEKSQADIDFEIMEKIRSDNAKAVKAFEARNSNKKTKDEFPDTRDNPLNPFDKNLDDFALGGRAGFAGGKVVLGKKILDLLKNNKKIQEAVDNIFGTGDYKMDAEMAAESLVELNPKTFDNKLYEDLDDATRIEIYGAVLEPIQKNMALMKQLKKASKPEKTLAAIKEGKGIDMSDPDIADEFARFMKETDPQGSKKIEQTVEITNFDPKGRKKNATGGRAEYYTGGIADVEPSLDDIGHGSDSLMARTRLLSPNNQATTSTGLNYLLPEDNDNIRVPFSKGKLADAARRKFMKMLGGIGGGIAALKTGLLGLSKQPAKQVTEEVVKSAESGTPPSYFFKLVEKIKKLGDDITAKNATTERQQITRYKDYELTEDVGTGELTIQKIKTDTDFNYYDETLAREDYMNYKPRAGQSDEAGSVADEYIEDTGYLRTSGPDKGELYDSMDGLTDDALEEIMEEVGEKVVKIKKADGGRIGFSKGKLVFENAKRFLEKIFGKENMAEMPNRDPEMYQGMLEVVDMFRKRDKEGLKKYLQKFLPHMDDAQIEDFIVGDAEDMAGLGKFGLGNLQGQLIRLGSGRDYAGKIEAFKRLERNKKLKDLEITEDMKRKPNASGGLANLLGE